ncbi:hypothetical protein [Providencia rustigianii]|uniref:hypothetical protein n=1 Tax=Providencia rustigianii TaxID=158850 RepID=UPI0038B24B2E
MRCRFARSGDGHVGFVVGKTESGVLLVLDGNQSDANAQDWSSHPDIIQEFFFLAY